MAADIETSGREIRPPSKFSECLVGEELELIYNETFVPENDTEYEKPVKHPQVNRKTNNVTFKTMRAQTWKSVITNYFGISKTNTVVQRTGTVIKVVFDTDVEKNITAKVNIYESGSVVMQGAKCTTFADMFFDKLKSECDLFDNQKVNCITDNVHQTKAKILEDSQISDTTITNVNNDDNSINTDPFNNSTPNTTNVIDNDNPINLDPINHSTPNKENSFETPDTHAASKTRVLEHRRSMDSKFAEIHTILSTVDNSMQHFIKKLSELQNVTSNVPQTLQNMIKESMSSQKKKILENLETVVNKVKHCSTTIDSLHVKCNNMDSQLNRIEVSQSTNSTDMQKMERTIASLVERVEELENKMPTTLYKPATEYNHDSSDVNSSLHENTCIQKLEKVKVTLENKHESTKLQDISSVPRFDKMFDQPPSETTTNKHQTKCDYLILSDSILRRVQPKRFTPDAITIKRFIRGGATTCANFIDKYGKNFDAKNVILHIGTRDLQKEGVKVHEFEELFQQCITTMKETNIYMSLITKRMDQLDENVDEANRIIRSVCEKFPNISIIDEFRPSANMFHDKVHLNNSGIPAIVKHLKLALGISRPSEDKPYVKLNNPNQFSANTPRRGEHNRPLSAPPYHSSQSGVNYQQSVVRPHSNPSIFENCQPQVQNTNSFPPPNQMQPPYQWIPPQYQANMFMPWRNPWGWPPGPTWPPPPLPPMQRQK